MIPRQAPYNRVVADLGKLDESKNSLLVETSLLSNNSNVRVVERQK
jgi:hypothetical protein